jgi:hypothetical protein
MFIPTIAMITLGFIFTLPNDIPIGIVNFELNCSNFTTNRNFTTKCVKANLSCRLIDEIRAEETLKVISYDSISEAFIDGKSGKLNAIFELPQNFTEVLVDRLDLYDNFDDDVIDQNEVSDLAAVHLDNTHLHLTQFLRKSLQKAVERFFEKFLNECRFPERLARVSGVVFENPIFGSKDGTFLDDIFYGYLVK